MYRRTLSILSFSAAFFVSAQQYVHQVLVLNEGYFDWQEQQQVVPVTLGSYDPSSGTYQTVATIDGSRFASDVEVHDQFIYVAADAKLLKFNRDDHSLMDEVEVEGIRKIAVWNDLILITRGELGGLPHYFEVRNAGDLELVTVITPADGLPHSIEDVVVADDRAWLGVNNAFEWGALTGYVAVVDLADLQLVDTIELGPEGLNPEKLMVTSDALYVLNNTDFTASSISKISRQSLSLDITEPLALNSGCGASALAPVQEKVYFMEYAVNTLARFDLVSGAVMDTLFNGISAYGLVDDHINGVMYATTTDFFSSGELHVMQYDGIISASVPVGVGPGHLALDIRMSTGITTEAPSRISVFPNPAVDRIRISGFSMEKAEVRIMDALGRQVWDGIGANDPSGIEIGVSGLNTGIYTVQVAGAPAVRFVKQ